MKKYFMIIAVVIVLAAVGIFVFKNSNATNSSQINGNVIDQESTGANADSNIKIINVKATRFQYDPSTITVKQGEHIKLVIDNQDTVHGIAIPELNASGIDTVEFTADKAGTYQFKCPTMCGAGHRNMTGTLIVEPL